jgi:hypothetical protein
VKANLVSTAMIILGLGTGGLTGCADSRSASPQRGDGTSTSGTAANPHDAGGELGMDRRSTAGQNTGGMGPGGMGGTGSTSNR